MGWTCWLAHIGPRRKGGRMEKRLALLLGNPTFSPHIPNSPAVLKTREKERLDTGLSSFLPTPSCSSAWVHCCSVLLLDLHSDLISWGQEAILIWANFSFSIFYIVNTDERLLRNNGATESMNTSLTSLASDELYNTQRIEDGQHNLTLSCYLKCNLSQTRVRIT